MNGPEKGSSPSGIIKNYRGDRRDYTAQYRGEKPIEVRQAEVPSYVPSTASLKASWTPETPMPEETPKEVSSVLPDSINQGAMAMLGNKPKEDSAPFNVEEEIANNLKARGMEPIPMTPLPKKEEKKVETAITTPPLPAPAQIPEPSASPYKTDLKTDFIVNQETGGKNYYNKALSRPSWPKASSGVTIGVGYDLGYNTPEQIREDWKGKIPDEQIERLVQVAGIKGDKAKEHTSGLKDVQIPYDIAQKVFQEKTLPRFEKMTRETFGPEIYDKLSPEGKTALTSLVFNRGSDLEGDRRREMAQIKRELAAGNYEAIPGLFRSMKRLWQGQGVEGLLKRRDDEANLFAAGNVFNDIRKGT